MKSDFAAMSDVDAEGEVDEGEFARTSNVEVERIEVENDLEKIEEKVELEREVVVEREMEGEGEKDEKEKGKGKGREIEKEEEEPRSDHSWTEDMIVDVNQLISSKALLQLRNRLARTQAGVKTAVQTLLGLVTRVENYKDGIRIVKNLEDFVKSELDIVEEIARDYLEGDL